MDERPEIIITAELAGRLRLERDRLERHLEDAIQHDAEHVNVSVYRAELMEAERILDMLGIDY